jgi:hypothetical protein
MWKIDHALDLNFQLYAWLWKGRQIFKRRTPTLTPKFLFLININANVALASRIAKDPRGTPVTERISETYKKNVSTDFKLMKRDKRRLEDADDK